MNQDLIEIKKDILNYIPIIYKEYGVDSRLIKDIVNHIDDRVRFSNQTISFFVRDGVLHLPELSYNMLNELKQHPRYNTTINTGVKCDNYLDTKTSYTDYINHIINDGLEPIDYFKESLLHEVMHMCGGGGGNPLQEGINELKTRELAKKHNLKIAAVGYQKEVEIVKELQSIVGKEVMDNIEFMNPMYSALYIEEHVGKEEADLYNAIYKEMKIIGKEYNTANRMVKNPYDKAAIYDKVDYSNVNKIINTYKENKKVI